MNLFAYVELRTINIALARLRTERHHADEFEDFERVSGIQQQMNALIERRDQLLGVVFDPLSA